MNYLLCLLRRLDSNQITFIWIQSPVDQTGHDRAETLVKEALRIGHILLSLLIIAVSFYHGRLLEYNETRGRP